MANDVIQNSKKKGPEYRTEFVKVLPRVFQGIHKLVSDFTYIPVERDSLSEKHKCTCMWFVEVLDWGISPSKLAGQEWYFITRADGPASLLLGLY